MQFQPLVESSTPARPWPELPYDEWKDTCKTLHMWTQIVGKIRLAQTAWVNHGWNVCLYVTAHGLTTSPIPYEGRTFEIDFDFVRHQLRVQTSDGAGESFPLEPRSVADFYRALFACLGRLGIHVKIVPSPNEVAEPIPFERDLAHRAYDRGQANRFFRALSQADRVLKVFRAGFIGKCSPVHFFWGSFDLAVTRFSGRRAPPHPGGVPHLPDRVTREAYSHEVSSCGFWPGNDLVPEAAFYSYAYPEPEGFPIARVQPAAARYDTALHEHILPYEAVRKASSPDALVLDFLESTYVAAAELGGWERSSLER
jgi:hypothetical protein